MISIVTSLYRTDRYLSKFSKRLEKVAKYLTHHNVDFELIIIANDPTEAEKAFGERFKQEKWFNFVGIPRETIFATWNRGVEMAKGEVVGFWNVDDRRHPEAIEEAAKWFKQGADLVYFPFLIIWYYNIKKWSFPVKFIFDRSIKFDKREFTRSMRCGPFFMFTKDLYKRVGPFDEQLIIVSDFDWCVRAAKVSDKLVLARNSAGIFRVDGTGNSSGGKPIHVAENNIVLRRHNVPDKIMPVDSKLEEKYQVQFIFYKGNFIAINKS